MNKPQFENELQRKIAELPDSMEPQKDLWAGIDIALTQNSQRQNEGSIVSSDQPKSAKVLQFTKIQQFALAASVVFVALFSWNNFNTTETGLDPNQVVRALTEQHAQQKQALLADFQGQPAATENWQEQLTELDEAAEAIKKALEEDPNNLALLKMLQQVYQQQIALIEKVHAPMWHQI